MKFKSDNEVQEQEVKIEKEKCNCPLCQSLNIANNQIDLLYSILSSLKSNLETIEKLHAEHNSE